MEAASWRRPSLPLILLTVVIVGELQSLLFPIDNTRISIQSLTGGVFLIVVIGLLPIPSSRDPTGLSAVVAEAVYPPMLLGPGRFTIRGLTGILDEFLGHPSPTLASREDGTVVIGDGLLLFGLARWARASRVTDGS